MNNKKNNIAKFFIIVFGIVSVFVFVAAVGVYAYKSSLPEIKKQNIVTEKTDVVDNIENNENEIDNGNSNIVLQPEPDKNETPAISKTNFLVLGTDQTGGLTDVILVCSFDMNTKKIDILSIPRDTQANLSQNTLNQITKRQGSAHPFSKINEVYGLSGQANGVDFTKLEIEKMLNIKFDYYAIIKTEAFRKIVDEIGGVKMKLTRNYYYEDPDQDLIINLKAGEQILTGKQAEHLIRYRHDYARGDVDRIGVQQQFMNEFFKQALNKDTIMSNIPGFFSTILSYVKTDFELDDLTKYIQYAKDIKSENIDFHILPGDGSKIQDNIGNRDYFVLDDQKTINLVNEIFYTSNSPEQENEILESKNSKIKILNGSNTNGIANKKKLLLESKGYNISETDSYEGEKYSQTRIMVKSNGLGTELKKYFVNAEIKIDKQIPDDFDIVIIVGTSEEE